jgi:hypothetical protein
VTNLITLSFKAADGTLLKGYDAATSSFVDADQPLGILSPGMLSDVTTVYLKSSASDQSQSFVLANVKLYLTGDPALVSQLLIDWPVQDAGIEMSFDDGLTYQRLTATFGNPSDPSTWILLPATAISSVASAGLLQPNDLAKLLLRVKVPLSVPAFGLFRIGLGVDVDVW